MSFFYKQVRKTCANERGIALVISMLLLVVLTVIGVAAVGTSNFEIMVAGSERRSQAAFHAAEAGLDHAKTKMTSRIIPGVGDIPPRWDPKTLENATEILTKQVAELGAVEKGSILLDKIALNGEFTYTVSVFNNRDGGDAATDTDGVIYLWSQAKGKHGGKAGVMLEYYTGTIFTADVQGQTSQLLEGAEKSGTSSDKNAMNTASNQFGLQATDLGQPNI